MDAGCTTNPAPDQVLVGSRPAVGRISALAPEREPSLARSTLSPGRCLEMPAVMAVPSFCEPGRLALRGQCQDAPMRAMTYTRALLPGGKFKILMPPVVLNRLATI